MVRTRVRRLSLTAFFIASLLIALVLTRGLWLSAMGTALVRTDPPFHADAVLVLAGDYSGYRILKAAELVKQGYAPVALVSGPMQIYGVRESRLAINFAVAKGWPAAYFIDVPNNSLSTRDEARFFFPEFRRRNIHRFLLVTSTFHSGRAGRVFRTEGRAQFADIEMRVVAAPDIYFSPDRWWQTREGQKAFFFESSKTLASSIGM